ncbi:MAG TPA: amidohydrolase family protein [Syntrophomonadaceae bacterium]|nr:amidohydrolase family protein [Syntrophomonadaceae bacterium]
MNISYSLNEKNFNEITAELSQTAMGILKADTVIRGGQIINVNTGEIEQNKDIAIKYGRIVAVGKVDHTIGEETKLINANGYILSPGFLDGHLHVESSMMTVGEFTRAVLPHGTTTIFMDPHEIANVQGMQGVKLMIDEGREVPMKVYATMPSCVPAAPGFEDAGAVFGPAEIEAGMKNDRIIGLGGNDEFPRRYLRRQKCSR